MNNNKYIALLAVLLLIGLGIFYIGLEKDTSIANVKNAFLPIPATRPDIANPEESNHILTISTTTPNGKRIIIDINLCDPEYKNDIGVCFGSGRSDPVTKNGDTSYYLVSTETELRYGLDIVRNNKETLYIATLTDARNVTAQEIEYYRYILVDLLKTMK